MPNAIAAIVLPVIILPRVPADIAIVMQTINAGKSRYMNRCAEIPKKNMLQNYKLIFRIL